MHCMSKTWIWIWAASCPISVMDGSIAMVCEFHSQWSFHPIIQPFLTNWKGWKLFLRNGAFGVVECFSSAEILNVIQLQHHVVPPKLSDINLTILLKSESVGHLCIFLPNFHSELTASFGTLGALPFWEYFCILLCSLWVPFWSLQKLDRQLVNVNMEGTANSENCNHRFLDV